MSISPKTATHMLIRDWHCKPGGNFNVVLNFFKFEDGVWKVYDTDSDNEYPGWILAAMVYRDFNKTLEEIQPIPPQLMRSY